VISEEGRVLEVAALLEAGELRSVGPVLTSGHASLRDDFEVSCAELDTAVEAALASGALGARMVGGGFGGSAIALIDVGAAGVLEQQVIDSFAAARFAAPRVFVAAPDLTASTGRR
jgi:galactokinase